MTSPACRCRQGGVSIFTALFFPSLRRPRALMARMTAVSTPRRARGYHSVPAPTRRPGRADGGLYQVLPPTSCRRCCKPVFAAANPPGLGVAVGCESFPCRPGDS